MNNYSNAQNLASYGRGNDTELIHMTPGEIKGLQAIALAHGGSLTINPNTGLPEAGFLEKILPMIAGAGLMMIPGVGPLAAAAMVGGGYGLATGSMEKGLMAGLGAYGGAGLTSSLASLGSEVGRTAAEQAATEGFKAVGQEAVTAGSQEVAKEAAAQAAQGYINPANFPGLSPAQLQASQSAVPELLKGGASPESIMGSLGRASATQAAPAGVTGSNVAAGLKEVGTNLPAAGQFAASNIGTLGSAALPLLAADQQAAGQGGYEEDEYDRRLKGYRLSPDYQAYVAPRPNPYYRATYAAEGGVMNSFDDEAGSDAVGMASGGIARYRNKGKTNVMQDYLDRQEKEQEQMQKHLSTNPSSYFPDVGIFRDPDIDTSRKDALTASMIRLGKAGKAAGIKARPLPKTSIKGLGDVSGATPEIEEAADGGVMGYNLGGYSDGGRMLEGPGDGMSDSIPASIAGKQPARLADGEFVVPADVVSHLGNGSTDAGAKKLYAMMDKIRMARTGTKEQAPEIKADKFLPVKQAASGGIAGYAGGGAIGYASGGVTASEVTKLYKDILGREPDKDGLNFWVNSGQSLDSIRTAFNQAPEAQVIRLYQEQLGRKPDAAGLAYWAGKLSSGTPLTEVSQGINNALEGTNFDTQLLTSIYRQELGRNPEGEGFQYWLSQAQASGLTPDQIRANVREATNKEKTERNITKQFTEMELPSLESDPYGGRYATKSIYDIAEDAENVSTINGRKVQFVTPVTQQAVISDFINGIYTAKQGVDLINNEQALAAINVALANGTLDTADYNALLVDLDAASKTGDVAQTRAALAKPRGQVVIDAIYGQQIGEAKTIEDARIEADTRQPVLNANDTGYYLSNDVLTQAYKDAGVSIPFEKDFYKDVDTRDRTPNVVTPENFQQKTNFLINAIRNNPYQPTYQPINQGRTPLPASTRDPYSMEGLEFLYGQMMDQYGTRNPNPVNPATAQYGLPVGYKPPLVNNLVFSTPIPDAASPAAPASAPAPDASAPVIAPASTSDSKAGGLMSIDRKKRAKTKPRRGLLAA
jgi:hypothetical protein